MVEQPASKAIATAIKKVFKLTSIIVAVPGNEAWNYHYSQF
jgi:hypothetical protein